MPRISAIKNHEERKQIERDIVSGKSTTLIAKKYNVTLEAIDWHKKNNIARQMTTAVKKSEGDHNINILQELNGLIKKTEKILQKAEDRNQGAQSLAAIRELRSSYALISAIQLELMKAGGLDGEGGGVLTEEEQLQRESEERFNAEFQEGQKLLLATEQRTFSDLLLKISIRNTSQIPTIKYTQEELRTFEGREYTPMVPIVVGLPSNDTEDDDTPFEEEPAKKMKRKKPLRAGDPPIYPELTWTDGNGVERRKDGSAVD